MNMSTNSIAKTTNRCNLVGIQGARRTELNPWYWTNKICDSNMTQKFSLNTAYNAPANEIHDKSDSRDRTKPHVS